MGFNNMFTCNGTTRRSTAFLLIVCFLFLAQPCQSLRCYSCSETFVSVLTPQICQMNATLAPVAECLSQETYCMVRKMKISDQVTSFTRGCAQACNPMCIKFDFVISSLTCTTCCGTELCNTGDGAVQIQISRYLLLTVFLLLTSFLGNTGRIV